MWRRSFCLHGWVVNENVSGKLPSEYRIYGVVDSPDPLRLETVTRFAKRRHKKQHQIKEVWYAHSIFAVLFRLCTPVHFIIAPFQVKLFAHKLNCFLLTLLVPLIPSCTWKLYVA